MQLFDGCRLAGQIAAMRDNCPLHPDHKASRAAWSTMQTFREFVKKGCGEGGMETLDCGADAVEVGDLEAGFEEVNVVCAEGLG